MIFGVLNPEKFDINSLYICPPHLYTMATLPWEIQNSHFSTVLFIYIWIMYIITEENKLLPLTHHI